MATLSRTTIGDVYLALKSILNVIARPIWVDSSSNIKGVTTVTTVTTVAEVMRVNSFGSATTNQQSTLYLSAYSWERTNWANNVRRCIT